jgi:hypothetical protein
VIDAHYKRSLICDVVIPKFLSNAFLVHRYSTESP